MSEVNQKQVSSNNHEIEVLCKVCHAPNICKYRRGRLALNVLFGYLKLLCQQCGTLFHLNQLIEYSTFAIHEQEKYNPRKPDKDE